MNNSSLYTTAVLIWGSTWLAIGFQLGDVPVEWSVAYRFALAALLLLVYCRWRRLPLAFGWRHQGFIALQGVLLFSLNYLLLYQATAWLTSGLVAVAHAVIVVMNIVNGAVLFGSPIRPQVVAGATLGLLGIALVFGGGEVLDSGAWWGLGLALAGTLSASLGNMAALRNQRHGLPVVQTNALGMAYGAGFMALMAVVLGRPLVLDLSPAYLSSLLYLAVFGSIVAFGSYLTLLGRIGADRAAYATVLFPVVALVLSALFEGYQWTPQALMGMGLVVAGNVLVLARMPGRGWRRGVRPVVPVQ